MNKKALIFAVATLVSGAAFAQAGEYHFDSDSSDVSDYRSGERVSQYGDRGGQYGERVGRHQQSDSDGVWREVGNNRYVWENRGNRHERYGRQQRHERYDRDDYHDGEVQRYGQHGVYGNGDGNSYHVVGAGPRRNMYRGGYLASEYRSNRYVVSDYDRYSLNAPPRGMHWVRAGNDYLLVAIATGLIASVLLNK